MPNLSYQTASHLQRHANELRAVGVRMISKLVDAAARDGEQVYGKVSEGNGQAIYTTLGHEFTIEQRIFVSNDPKPFCAYLAIDLVEQVGDARKTAGTWYLNRYGELYASPQTDEPEDQIYNMDGTLSIDRFLNRLMEAAINAGSFSRR